MSWIKTDTYHLSTNRGKLTTDHEAHFMLSPYDVPSAVRTYIEEGKLVIEFRYINIVEPKNTFVGRDDGIVLEVGSKTKRLYKVYIDNSLCNGSDPAVMKLFDPIKSAVDEFISKQENMVPNTAKYRAALSALSNYESLAHSQQSI